MVHAYRPSNGVSFGLVHTVSAQDVTDGSVTIDFGVSRYAIVAGITVVDATNINVELADAVITYPANGQVRIADGAATFALVAGQKISIVAQRASAEIV